MLRNRHSRQAHSTLLTPVLKDGAPVAGDVWWFASAACRGLPSDIFFVDAGKPTGEALAICERCPVQAQCLDYALERNEVFGVWGGYSQRELRLLRRERHHATG